MKPGGWLLAVVVFMACKESPKRPCTEHGAKCDAPQVVAVLELSPRPPAPPNTPDVLVAKIDLTVAPPLVEQLSHFPGLEDLWLELDKME
jgi:hypothetical protein